MAANIANKVVNLSEHARAISSTDSGRMLNDCRDLAMRRLTGSLRDMLAQVEEDLFQMAEASYDREMQTVYLDLRGKAKEKWPSIEAAFRVISSSFSTAKCEVSWEALCSRLLCLHLK